MNENLIDLNFDETQLQKASSESQPQLFACEGVVSERKSLSCVNSSFFKVTSETQTSDENLLEIVHDDFMQNRVVAIEPTPYTVTQGFFTSYKLYTIMSKKTIEFNFQSKVNRRFSDFEWLFHTLISKYPGYIIPELPEKNFLASMNFEKSEFIEARRKDLEKFLTKMLEHKSLRNAEELRSFLTDNEKEFSIMKGKCELNLKAFSVNFTKEIVGFLNRKNLNYLKKQNDEDKDLQNYKVYFNNMKQMAESLILNIEMLLELKEGDLKSLEKFEIASNEFIQNSSFSEENHIFNEQKMKRVQNFADNLEVKILWPLKFWIKNSTDILSALKRREILDEEVFEDTMKIEEMKKNILKTNNKRDSEMDLLQTRLDTNQKLLIKTTKTMMTEIIEYKRVSEQEIIIILKDFHDVHHDFWKYGGFNF